MGLSLCREPNILTPRAPDACVCCEEFCACPPTERVLRQLARGSGAPLNQEERTAMVDEIASVEGYDRTDWEGVDDAVLAHGVLAAWTDYARDKGLL